MKKLYLLFIPALFLLGSCTKEAEAFADKFHNKFDADEIDYIADNMVDTKATDEEIEGFRSFLSDVRKEGKPENREKSTGFSKKTNNGVTTVRLNYTFELEGEKVYEGLVLIDRGEGYKLHIVSMHPDKSVVDSFMEGF